MSDETKWFRVQFDFAIPNYDVDLDDLDRKKFLTGLGRATSILLMDPDMTDDERSRMKILVKELMVNQTDFITDDKIQLALEEFKRDMGTNEE